MYGCRAQVSTYIWQHGVCNNKILTFSANRYFTAQVYTECTLMKNKKRIKHNAANGLLICLMIIIMLIIIMVKNNNKN